VYVKYYFPTMKTNKVFILTVLLTISAITAVTAQVTIGADNVPQNFSVLELISNNTMGLRLPQLTTAQRDILQASAAFQAEVTGKAMGLQIFNTTTKCVETWNGAEWIQACSPSGPVLPPVSPSIPASCNITPSNSDKTFTAKPDPNAETYEFFVNNVSQGEQATNSITFATAQTPANVKVAYLYSLAFLKPKMIAVEGGSFTIGAETASFAAVSGSGPVTVSNFKMSETPITQAQFEYVMGTNPAWFQCSEPGAVIGGIAARPTSALPVEQVNWYGAIAYCNKLSIKEGKTPVYTVSGVSDWLALTYPEIPISTNSNWDAATQNLAANGYRLPTEAEWEYAARGGKKSITNDVAHPLHLSGKDYDYSGDNVLANVGWYDGNNGTGSSTTPPYYGTKPVKEKAANALGLYDMCGNMDEWCWNWWSSSYNTEDKGSNPVGPATGTYRIRRGGGWDHTPSNCVVSHRIPYDPWHSFYCFRVVATP
jgi:formylglycine-generating enzyme required for sulfatase activity